MTEISCRKALYHKLLFLVAIPLGCFVPVNQGFSQGPAIPQTDSISITDQGYPIITWFPNSGVTLGYVIVQKQGNIWQRIDTVDGINSTSYIDENSNACLQSQWYQIYATAGPDHTDSPWSDTLRTIFLDEPELNICGNYVSLNWTNYVNMVPELGRYQILASEDGGPFQEVGLVDDILVTTFNHQNLNPGILYTYKIRAVSTDGSRTSSSCEQSIRFKTYAKPDYAHLRYVTVENNSDIHLEWIADEAPISAYRIMRSDGGGFSEVGEIRDEVNYNPPETFTDTTANVGAQSYEYRIDVIDSCGKDLLSSVNMARSILLSGVPNVDYENELSWNEYEGWDLGVKEYEIYRRVNDVPDPSGPLTTVPAGTTSYVDDVSSLDNTGGTFSYYVIALENEGDNGYEDTPDESKSNEITITQETRVLVPNAYIPGSGKFKPVTAFIDQQAYEMMIFNKWGQMIFQTSDSGEGWDGRFKGELVPAGAYVYLIKYRTPDGQTLEKRGTVTVVR